MNQVSFEVLDRSRLAIEVSALGISTLGVLAPEASNMRILACHKSLGLEDLDFRGPELEGLDCLEYVDWEMIDYLVQACKIGPTLPLCKPFPSRVV